MTSLLLVIFSLLLLYISKRKLSIEFSRLIHRFGGSHHALIIFWSIIFLPGTVIHEMSHFLFAILTGTRTGKIEIFPRLIEEDWESEERGGVTLGYVQTERLNLLQGFLVGTAPFFVGILLLIWLASNIQISYDSVSILPLLAYGYFFFTVSNSFFPSWTDIKHTLPLIVLVIVLGIMGWLIGVRVLSLPYSQLLSLSKTITSVTIFSSTLNFFVILLLIFIRKAFSRHH